MKKLTSTEIKVFQDKIYSFYASSKREFAWRQTRNPYFIYLSEIMLQQTQTRRVENYYTVFTQRYPTVEALARASQKQIIRDWQGLGYNRRALNLKKSAEIILHSFDGQIPNTFETLTSLPGIGPGTAGAILCYAFNKPVVFIETNIRTVFLYEFLLDKTNVSDQELQVYVESTLDTSNPRDWFYALTDYGVFLKSSVGNAAKNSKHYTKQSKFEGSNRQKRSLIIKALLMKSQTMSELSSSTKLLHKELIDPVNQLIKEGFIKKTINIYSVV